MQQRLVRNMVRSTVRNTVTRDMAHQRQAESSKEPLIERHGAYAALPSGEYMCLACGKSFILRSSVRLHIAQEHA